MEIIKAMCLDWLLFNILESWLALYYIQKLTARDKINLTEWLIFSLVMTLITQFIPPMLRQVIFIFIVIFICFKSYKYNYIKECIKIGILIFALWFIVESVWAIFLNKIFDIHLEEFQTFKLFLLMMVPKCMEYIIMYVGGKFLMKMIWGNIKKGK